MADNAKLSNHTYISIINKVPVIASTTLVGITALTGLLLTSSTTSADVVDDIVITVPVSCNVTSSLDEAHTATINPGQSATDIGTTNFTVFCNDNTGYAIYAIGYSNEEYGNTKLLATINNQLSPTNDIETSTATTGGTSAWAMKLIPVTTASSGTTQPYTPTIESDANGSFSDYHIVPEEYTKVATFTSNTDFTIGSSLQSTYQVYIDGTKPAGTYNGKVKYTLIHPNDGAVPTIPPAPSTSCNTPVPNLTYMQDLNSTNKASILANMTEDSQYYLRDARDEKPYCVAKLKDGNIWMTENLDHDIDSTKTYTPTDTDISANWTPSKSTYATVDTTWESSYTTPESYDPGDKIWNGTPDTNYETTLDNMTQGTDAHYHIGNYYNWTAAVAMNDTSGYDTRYDDVNQSICPAGWTLPKGGDLNEGLQTQSGSFQYLVSQYNWNSSNYTMENLHFWEAPLYFSLSGYWNGESYDVASYGYFWSSVVNDSGNSYNLNGNAYGYVNPDDSIHRFYGFSVRCVSR